MEDENWEARAFYATLAGPARVGMEATVTALWFESLLSEYGHDLWVGDAAAIRAADGATSPPTYVLQPNSDDL